MSSAGKMINDALVEQVAINGLERENERSSRDVDAYRGALGYSVRGDHNGLLTDGTAPNNGIAEALQRRVAELEQENRELKHDLDLFLKNVKPATERMAELETTLKAV